MDASIETSGNKISQMNEEEVYELRNLREAAKIASIYHRTDRKFQRNRKLSHIVHAALNFVQFLLLLIIEIFHHVHRYYVHHRFRETNENLSILTGERKMFFFLYPICMLISLLFAVLWLIKKFLPKRPLIALIGCIFGAISMLSAGIMQMKQADWHIDLREITDEKLLDHPVFVHYFSMCILSIFVMTFYLIHIWILFDVWQWMKKFGKSPDNNESEYDSSYLSTDSEIIEDSSKSFKIELPGKLNPIPALNKFIIKPPIEHTLLDEPVILYCCCVDCYNYIKESRKTKPKHEFQVIHVL